MDELDRLLLNLLQKGLPMESSPFLKLANELNITEEEVIARTDKLKSQGYIRRLGGIVDSKKLGYYSTLCAISVPDEKIDKVARIINKFNEITHNYVRNYYYNIWFTIIAPSKDRVDEIVNSIKVESELEKVLTLPAVRLFKINATFNMLREIDDAKLIRKKYS
ncbi:AsnC family transcriptional regulator [Clostridium sp. DJ247]|uniref:siroheme decarboxylase subunit alpha n=1 Tax=Clostridium sp. DJ247 TaxID=2726188 RepID=UPI0016267172|nr:AsnC family transcriptional regulator [Clostridium sp. DJ247]MBC2581835.1 Lrp/AsnC family transcriptional regulator [Clostridium sp. DJ247]